VISGIVSVWFSRKENIWVYPTGLINTIFYIYLSFKGSLLGEASVNLYYTIMSIYGWILWAKKNQQQEHIVNIMWSTKKEWMQELIIFCGFLCGYFWSAQLSEKRFCTSGNSLGRCVCKFNRFYRDVADGKKKS